MNLKELSEKIQKKTLAINWGATYGIDLIPADILSTAKNNEARHLIFWENDFLTAECTLIVENDDLVLKYGSTKNNTSQKIINGTLRIKYFFSDESSPIATFDGHKKEIVSKPAIWIEPNQPLEDIEALFYSEGTPVTITVNRYERDPKARQACIAIHGSICKACKFDFEKVYGELGKGFIHVHHTTPLAFSKKTKTDPAKDLIPLCANCHAMIHRRDVPAMSIEDLVKIMEEAKRL